MKTKPLTMEELNTLFPNGIPNKAFDVINDPAVPEKKVRTALQDLGANLDPLATIAPTEVLVHIVNKAYQVQAALQWYTSISSASDASPMDKKLLERKNKAEAALTVAEGELLELFINPQTGAIENPNQSVLLCDQISAVTRMMQREETPSKE